MEENKLENQRFADLYNKYLRAICSEEEARELLKILEEPANDQLIKTAAFKAWNEIPDTAKTDDSIKEILNDLHHRININEQERIETTIS